MDKRRELISSVAMARFSRAAWDVSTAADTRESKSAPFVVGNDDRLEPAEGQQLLASNQRETGCTKVCACGGKKEAREKESRISPA